MIHFMVYGENHHAVKKLFHFTFEVNFKKLLSVNYDKIKVFHRFVYLWISVDINIRLNLIYMLICTSTFLLSMIIGFILPALGPELRVTVSMNKYCIILLF